MNRLYIVLIAFSNLIIGVAACNNSEFKDRGRSKNTETSDANKIHLDTTVLKIDKNENLPGEMSTIQFNAPISVDSSIRVYIRDTAADIVNVTTKSIAFLVPNLQEGMAIILVKQNPVLLGKSQIKILAYENRRLGFTIMGKEMKLISNHPGDNEPIKQTGAPTSNLLYYKYTAPNLSTLEEGIIRVEEKTQEIFSDSLGNISRSKDDIFGHFAIQIPNIKGAGKLEFFAEDPYRKPFVGAIGKPRPFKTFTIENK